jgi:hypothetical protein
MPAGIDAMRAHENPSRQRGVSLGVFGQNLALRPVLILACFRLLILLYRLLLLALVLVLFAPLSPIDRSFLKQVEHVRPTLDGHYGVGGPK